VGPPQKWTAQWAMCKLHMPLRMVKRSAVLSSHVTTKEDTRAATKLEVHTGFTKPQHVNLVGLKFTLEAAPEWPMSLSGALAHLTVTKPLKLVLVRTPTPTHTHTPAQYRRQKSCQSNMHSTMTGTQ
jgi:hypothetical protein